MNMMNKKTIKKLGAAALSSVMAFTILSGCSDSASSSSAADSSTKEINSKLDTDKQINLTIAGPWTNCKAMEIMADSFSAKYPNCHLNYEYLQDFSELLPKRLSATEDTADLFITSTILKGNELANYALDFYTVDDVDISNTFDGLIKNSEYTEDDGTKKLYSIPFGAELRGMYVNTTLLDTLNIEMPKNYTQLMDACATLKNAGYTPFQGNPGYFAQRLMYPYVCNIVANSDDYDATWNLVNSHTEEAAELFRKPLQNLYDMVANGYYNYKYIEVEKNMFIDMSDEGSSRYFLNIAGEDDFTKVDDVGTVAFMPGTASLQSIIDKTKDDYHSQINYEFVLSPVSDEGGFAYLSPAHSIAVNKNGDNTDWCCEFVDFIFETDNNKKVAEAMDITPNTSDAFDIITSQYDIPKEQISHLGQVTFDYKFFDVINGTLTDISKSNNPKYMDKDGTEMYDFEYYMDNLKKAMTAVGTEENADE